VVITGFFLDGLGCPLRHACFGCLDPCSWWKPWTANGRASTIGQFADVIYQLLLDALQLVSGVLVVLLSLGRGQVDRKPVDVIKDCSPNFFVRGVSPECLGFSAGTTWDSPNRRRAEPLLFSHQHTRPRLQILEQLVKLSVQFVVTWDIPDSLLHVCHHIDNFTQDPIEGDNRVMGSWCPDGSTGARDRRKAAAFGGNGILLRSDVRRSESEALGALCVQQAIRREQRSHALSREGSCRARSCCPRLPS
jgi:hypothetical protein